MKEAQLQAISAAAEQPVPAAVAEPEATVEVKAPPESTEVGVGTKAPQTELRMEPVELPPDLVLVETRAERVEPAAVPSHDEPGAGRRPRPQPVQDAVPEEPLVQVETRKTEEPASPL